MAPNDSSPQAWSLGGDPPEPQKVEAPKPLTEAQGKRLDNAATHTGTDPLGRAIGPAENHKTIKKVRDLDGKVVTPDAKTGETPAQKKARREKAEADAATAKDKS